MELFSIQILKLLEFILTKSRKPCFAFQETMSKAFTSLFLKRFTHKDLVTNYHQHGTNIAGPTEHATCQPVVHIYKRTASPNASASAFLTKLPFQNAALRLLQGIEQRVGVLHTKFWFIYIFLNHKKFHNVPRLLFLLRRHLQCVSAPSVAPKFASSFRWIL